MTADHAAVKLLKIALSLGAVALVLWVAVNSSGNDASRRTAGNAAEIGDHVSVSGSTIMCSRRKDAETVYLVGEMVMQETLRVEGSAWKAVSARSDARKSAMRDAYSCTRPASLLTRYRVEQKDISASQSVAYCVKPGWQSETCWWIIEDVNSPSPFRNVEEGA